MKLQRNKTLSAIALTLILTTAFMTILPVANAHTPPWNVPTHCYAVCTVNPVGAGQPTGITFWLNAVPPTAFGAYGDRWTFTIEITKPDGSKDNIGPITSDPVGGGYTTYRPTQVGTYTVVVKFPNAKVTGIPIPPGGVYFTGGDFINDTFLASQSNPVTLVVQTDPIKQWPDAPLPTMFWTRPINSLNRNWASIQANWLAGAAQNYPLGSAGGCTTQYSYGPGPESAHVMWSQPIWAGGLMDARFGDIGYYNYHYEGLRFTPPIILNGKVYYNVPSLPIMGWYCLDLYTGEKVYFQNTTGPVTGSGGGFDASGSIQGGKLAFGQIFDYESPNQHGGIPYLWSTTDDNGGVSNWRMYDAFTGNYICGIKNVPTGVSFFGAGLWGTQVYGKDGSLTAYNIVGTSNPANPFAPEGPPFYLRCWNASRAIWYEPIFTGNNYWMWRPTLNMTFDGINGYSLNVTLPWTSSAGSIRAVREGEYLIGGTSGRNNGTNVQQGYLWALSLKPGQEGTLLWNITFTPPQQASDLELSAGGLFGTGSIQGPTVSPENGVFLFNEVLGIRWWGYSLTTGQQLWGPTPGEPSLNFYGMQSNIYEGKLLTCGYGGVLIAYDIKTGKQLWNYTAQNVGFESPYGNYPMGIGSIADGKIYIGAGEHSITQPPWRGPVLRCINASNGAEIWKFPLLGVSMASGNAGDNFAIADGYLLALNGYDNQIYCFGKGPSAMTVDAPMTSVMRGDSVVIRGTVTDQCAGAKKLVADGKLSMVPAMSDADQEAWMKYLYMQQAEPTNAKGVLVHLTAIDPNGNFQDLGTATSNALGNFAVSWTPPVPGLYVVTATFEGSNSYYGSKAGTSFAVLEKSSAAPVVTPTVAPTPPTPTASIVPTQTPVQPVSPSPTSAPPPAAVDMTTTYIAIAAAIIIIAVVAAAIALRRRK